MKFISNYYNKLLKYYRMIMKYEFKFKKGESIYLTSVTRKIPGL